MTPILARLRPRHIALLRELGRDPNLGRCAARLHMSQSAASKALREIESILEAPLFVRNRRGLSPTALGTVVTRRAGILFEEMHALCQEVEGARSGGGARIRVGVFPVVLPGLFPAWRERMLAAWPGLTIAATEGAEFTLLAELSAGRLDCILGRLVLERLTPDLRHELLYQESTAIVCGPRHPAAGAASDRLLGLMSQAEWILPSPEGASFNLVASRLAEAGHPPPRVAIEAISVYLTVEMLGAATLLSLLPRPVAQAFAALGKVHVLPVTLPASRKPVGIIFRRDADRSPIIASALRSAREAAAALPGRPAALADAALADAALADSAPTDAARSGQTPA